MNEWHDFFVATAGASAALTGLIFVGVSINLTRILSFPNLPSRALISLVVLVVILLISIVALIPGQPVFAIGIEVLIIGIAVWLMVLFADISIIKNSDKQYKKASFYNLLFDQAAVLPYLVAAIFLLAGYNCGLYCIVAAFFLSIIKAITDAWVLLIEINR
jgi:hypothetical protein